MSKSIFLTGLALVILLFSGCLPSTELNTGNLSDKTTTKETKEEPKQPVIYKVNDVVEVDGKKMAITEVKDYVPTNEFMRAKEGRRFLAVMIELENVSNKTTTYNALNYSLVDKDGAKYNEAFSDIDPNLSSGTLQPTRKAKGYLSYEVPADMTNDKFELIYEPLSFVDTTQVVWELN